MFYVLLLPSITKNHKKSNHMQYSNTILLLLFFFFFFFFFFLLLPLSCRFWRLLEITVIILEPSGNCWYGKNLICQCCRQRILSVELSCPFAQCGVERNQGLREN